MPYDEPMPTEDAHPARKRGGRKTGPKPRFSYDDVVDAAIPLGIDTFTISAVAAELGVAAPAVYRLFDGREALAHACLERATSTLTWPSDAPDWKTLLHLWCDEAWAMCERFPGIDKLLLTSTSTFSHFEQGYASVVDRLRDFGFTAGQAVFALDLLIDIVLSSHMNIASLRAIDADGRSDFSKSIEAFTSGVFVPDESWTKRGFLDLKIDFIIAGLEDRRPEVESDLPPNDARA